MNSALPKYRGRLELLFTQAEAAARLGCSLQHVGQLLQARRLCSVWAGRCLLVTFKSVMAHLARPRYSRKQRLWSAYRIPYVSRNDAREIAGCSRYALEQAVAAGQLHTRTIGHMLLYSIASLERWAKRR